MEDPIAPSSEAEKAAPLSVDDGDVLLDYEADEPDEDQHEKVEAEEPKKAEISSPSEFLLPKNYIQCNFPDHAQWVIWTLGCAHRQII